MRRPEDHSLGTPSPDGRVLPQWRLASHAGAPGVLGFAAGLRVGCADLGGALHAGRRARQLPGASERRCASRCWLFIRWSTSPAAPELNAGALPRYGRGRVVPDEAGRAGDGLTWKPMDDERAEATLTDGSTTVSLQFRFDDQGGPDRTLFTRPVQRGERRVRVDAVARARGPGRFGGMRTTSPAVVEWVLPDGPLPYWCGRIRQSPL